MNAGELCLMLGVIIFIVGLWLSLSEHRFSTSWKVLVISLAVVIYGTSLMDKTIK